MLKIDVIRFEAQDVITTSVPVAEEKAPVVEAPAKPVCNCPDEHFYPQDYKGSVVLVHFGSAYVDDCPDCPVH